MSSRLLYTRSESRILLPREGMSLAAHLNSIRSAWRALARGRTFLRRQKEKLDCLIWQTGKVNQGWTRVDGRRKEEREGGGKMLARAKRPRGLSRSTGAATTKGRWKSCPFFYRSDFVSRMRIHFFYELLIFKFVVVKYFSCIHLLEWFVNVMR